MRRLLVILAITLLPSFAVAAHGPGGHMGGWGGGHMSGGWGGTAWAAGTHPTGIAPTCSIMDRSYIANTSSYVATTGSSSSEDRSSLPDMVTTAGVGYRPRGAHAVSGFAGTITE